MTSKKPLALQSTERGAKKDKKVGLARALSKLGYCSRTQAFALIREGKVGLNGATPRNPETPTGRNERFHTPHRGGIMFEYDKLREVITRLTLAFLFCAPAYARPQAVPQRSVPDAPARVPARPADIISDNLDRVAASADQILEVLNKEAGLMVELKNQLAKDAGASGQILEESDLSDAAISERLKQDVHIRVLATRLLRGAWHH